MKTLTIIRHARQDRNNPNLVDFEYPLTEQGTFDAKAMGKFLAKLNVKWDLVVSSAAKRAFTTAQILLDEMGFASSALSKEITFYSASLDDIRRFIATTSDNINSLALVGHNPLQQRLVNHYTLNIIDDFPTMAVAILSFDVNNWADLDKHKAQDFKLLTPKTIANE